MVLITGATGLVGSHLLASLLMEEQPIRALYRTQSKKEATLLLLKKLGVDLALIPAEKLEWKKADITRIPELTDAFEGITHVYHCAGLVSYDLRDYQNLRKINIEGTANVVNLALAKKVQKLCHVSSIAALGSELKQKPITENSPRNNDAEHDNYSISKYGAEMEVWRASQEGLPVVIVNPGVIIGRGNWDSGSGQLFTRVSNGFSYYFPKVTGFVSVEDVTRAMVELMKSKTVNEGFILVAESCSFKKVLFEIADRLGKKRPKKPLKKWMIFTAWIVQATGNFLFNTKQELTRQSIKGAFQAAYFDTSKIEKTLSFKFTPISVALKHTSQAFLEDKNNAK